MLVMGLMATGFKAFAGALLVVMGLMAVRVSAQAHHVVGDDNGWGPDLDVSSWLSGRVFRVGDRIWFKYSGTEDSIIELEGLEEFVSCNLTNPIKMYTDPVSHVVLDKEGPRYFTSRNPERCKNGLKLPVNVRPSPEYDPPFPDEPTPPHGPFPPFKPAPPYVPPVHDRPPPPPPPPHEPPVYDRPPPPPPHEPPVYDRPPPPPPHEPPVPVRPPPPPPHEPPVPVRPPPEPPVPVRPPPPPPHEPPVPVRPPPPPPHEPPPPSAAGRVSVLSFVLAGGMLLCVA